MSTFDGIYKYVCVCVRACVRVCKNLVEVHKIIFSQLWLPILKQAENNGKLTINKLFAHILSLN